MSYSNIGPPKVTIIDDLLDLDNDSHNYSNNHLDILPNGQEVKYNKYIRQKHTPKYQEQQIYNSGDDYNLPTQIQQQHAQQHAQQHPPAQFQHQHAHPHAHQQHLSHHIPFHSPYSCLDVAGHIDNCPICAKFYKNDKSIYIVTIVLLVIICIILLKKVLDC